MTMKRRTVLKLLSGVAAGSALGRNVAAWGQSPARSAVGAEASAGSPGASSKHIKSGMTAAFKGPSAGLGVELYRGALAYYNEVNQRGGIHGRSISVVALDDGYEPTPCVKNTIELVEREQVFFLS